MRFFWLVLRPPAGALLCKDSVERELLKRILLEKAGRWALGTDLIPVLMTNLHVYICMLAFEHMSTDPANETCPCRIGGHCPDPVPGSYGV